MSAAALEQTLPDECFAQEEFNVLFCPLLRRQGLQKHHNLLKIHFAQLIRPFDEESCTNIEMEGREPVFFSLQYVRGLSQRLP